MGENDAAVTAKKIEAASMVTGVLVGTMGSDAEKQALQRLQEQHVPIVLIDRYLFDLNPDSVVVDDFSGAYPATQHLIDLGHHRAIQTEAVMSKVVITSDDLTVPER